MNSYHDGECDKEEGGVAVVQPVHEVIVPRLLNADGRQVQRAQETVHADAATVLLLLKRNCANKWNIFIYFSVGVS